MVPAPVPRLTAVTRFGQRALVPGLDHLAQGERRAPHLQPGPHRRVGADRVEVPPGQQAKRLTGSASHSVHIHRRERNAQIGR